MAHVPRIYWPQAPAAGATLSLDAERAHHLLRVLKRRIGDPVCLFNPPDCECDAEIIATGRDRVELRVTGERRVQRESPLALRLVQAIARGDKMELVIQKSVELGVTAILPVMSARGGVQLDARRQEKKQAHWQAVALSAAEQSGRTRVPNVAAPQTLTAYFAAGPHHGWVLDPAGESRLPSRAPEAAAPFDLLVGPEAGLDPAEIGAAVTAGLIPLRLGPRILRTETAGITALAALQARWGDLLG